MTTSTTPHPPRYRLAAFNRGALPPGDRAAIEAHVAECDACCSALAAMSDDRLVDLARQAAATSSTTELPATEVPPELADHPRYRVLAPVGAGGMGVVYKAEQRMMGRVVALKVMARRYTANPEAVARFRREVHAAARLNHPNIVTAHDADEAEGLHFLVMEYVEGTSLDRLVRRRGPLSVVTACRCIRQAALGLQHAHEQGMVHRDIKPHNLMVTRKGQVKVLDFGLARLVAEVDAPGWSGREPTPGPTVAVTTPSLVMGTPDYLAPEQARNASAVDIRADIYSLGCVLYFLLTGRPPFAGSGTVLEKMVAHSQDEPASVRAAKPEVPEALAAVVARMLAKDPAGRFATPGEVATALKPFTRTPEPIDGPEVVDDVLVLEAATPAPVSGIPTADAGLDVTEPAPRRRVLRQSIQTESRPTRQAWVIAIAVLVAAVTIGEIVLVVTNRDSQGAGRVASGPGTAGLITRPGARPGPAAAHKVLFVIPNNGLEVPEYVRTKERLAEFGCELVTASTSLKECRVAGRQVGSGIR